MAQTKEPSDVPPAGQAANEVYRFAGRVVNIDGQPVIGAKIFVAGHLDVIAFKERAISGPDGSFRFTIRRDEFHSRAITRNPTSPESRLDVGATADGFGATCLSSIKPDEREKLTICLPPEELIRGKIVDEDGKPVSGVRVHAHLASGHLDEERKPIAYDQDLKRGQWPIQFTPWDETRQSAVSNADGEITLRGLSRDWLYHLYVNSPKVVSLEDRLAARPQPPQKFGRELPKQTQMMTYGSTFTLTVEPCKPIIGVVRETGTGKPIPGVEIRRPRNPSSLSDPPVRATSEQGGKYTLTGLPHGAHRLVISPPDATPYLRTEVTADAVQAGFEPMTMDIDLPRQPAVAGLVTDAVTGKPISGYVEYRPMTSNKNLSDNPALSEQRLGNRGIIKVIADDGKFLIPALAGPGVLLVGGSPGYRTARLADEHRVDAIVHPEDRDLIDCRPFAAWPEEWQAYQFVEVAAGKTTEVAIQLAPAKSRPLVINYPDGTPTNTSVLGLNSRDWGGRQYHPGHTTVANVEAGETRRLFISTLDGKHGAVVDVSGNDAGPVTVAVKPTGTIVGRVTDKLGQPIVGAAFQLFFDDGPGRAGVFLIGGVALRRDTAAELIRDERKGGMGRDHGTGASLPVHTDENGRFRIARIVPDCAFDLQLWLITPDAQGHQIVSGEVIIARPTVKPGETLDLGELQVLEKPLVPFQRERLERWQEELHSTKPMVRIKAAESIGKLGPPARAAAPALRELMKQGVEPKERETAAAALWSIAPVVYSQIIQDRTSPERWTAIMSLHSIGKNAQELAPILLKIAADETDRSVERAHALSVLAAIGADSEKAVPVLIKGCRRNPYERTWSVQTLGQFGDKAKDALTDLHGALADADPVIRVHVAGAVWKIGGDRPRALSVLIEGLRGGDEQDQVARQQAIGYLGIIGPPAKDGFPKLLEIWRTSSADDVTTKYMKKITAKALNAIDPIAAEKEGVQQE